MTSTAKYRRVAPEQRRDQILEAANELFSEHGYDEVSVEGIASSAGVKGEPSIDTRPGADTHAVDRGHCLPLTLR
jgi:hypothetical protein